MKLKLRPYQRPARQAVFDYIRDNPGLNPLVAMPTGSGKTAVIVDLVNHAHTKWNTKILVISHVKEILEQNYSALSNWLDMDTFDHEDANSKISECNDPNADKETSVLGMYSAGFDKREIRQVTVAGIQSIYKKANLFKDYKFIIVDECHLISPDNNSMYQKFFDELDNPRICGLSATCFRLGQGYLTTPPNNLFHEIVYDLTSMDSFNQLVKDGYLCDLVSKSTGIKLDPDKIKKIKGDYSVTDMSDKFDRWEITSKAVNEIITAGANYKKWLIFAIDIEHADHIAEALNEKNISAMSIHTKSDLDRDFLLNEFRQNRIRALVNVNILTTGLDIRDIDLVVLLRPTTSPVLHVQMIGRGMRPYPGKDHCLVLDFAGNTLRLGPINDVHVETKRKGKGDPPAKMCPVDKCKTICHIKAKFCPKCNHKFQFLQKISDITDETILIAKDEPMWYDVNNTEYKMHPGYGNKPDIMKVTYTCGLKQFNEYICLQHKGYAGYLAKLFIKKRLPDNSEMPTTVREALKLSDLYMPATGILVKEKRKFPEIVRYRFE